MVLLMNRKKKKELNAKTKLLCRKIDKKKVEITWIFSLQNFCKIFRERESKDLIILQKQPAEVYYKKAVLKKFANLTRKHLCQSLFLKKVQVLSVKKI